MRALVVASFVGLSMGAVAAPASASTVWQGTTFVTGVTPGCAPSTGTVERVGSDAVMVYRPIIAGIQTGPEGLAWYTERSSQVFEPQAANVHFNGTGKYDGTGIGSHANPFKWTTGTYRLTVTPAAPTTATKVVTVSGSIANAWDTTGCTVTFTAVLGLRP